MWFYIPKSDTSVGSPEPAPSTSQLDSLSQRAAVSAMWRSKLQPAKFWQKEFAKDRWTTHRSTLTSDPGRQNSTVAAWISRFSGRPASRTAWPESNSANPMSATSGASSSTRWQSVDPPWFSLKTSLPLFPEALSEVLERNYAAWVIESKDRSSSLRRTLAQAIGGSESSSWPGVRVTTGQYTRDGGVIGMERLTLEGLAEQWPTPSIPGGGRTMTEEDVIAKGATAGGKRQVGLENVSKFWSTPNENRNTKAAPSHGNGHGRTLAGDAISHSSPPAQQIQDGPESSSDTPSSRRRLNPLFVAWLMNIPIGWTSRGPINCDAWETRSSLWLRHLLSACCSKRPVLSCEVERSA